MAKIGKHLGKLGGPLLGGAGEAIDRATERPTQAGADAARDVGERIQGRAAYSATRRRGNFLTNIVAQLAGGRKSPTRRGRAALIQRGNEWAQRENELAAGVARSRHDSAYREGGVVAGKAALVELAGGGGRTAEQAIIQLIGSSSYVEFQGSVIQRGRNRGKRVTEIGAWQNVLSDPANSQLWVEVGRRRPDLTPDVLQSAENAAGYRFDDVPGNQRALLDDLNRLCLAEAMQRFDAGVLPGLHEGIFNEIERSNDPVLAQQLFDRLRIIANVPGTVGRDALGALAGPRGQAIDRALVPIGESYSSI
ncbi:hypothetical protein A3F38_02310 [Candidatus Saccharibacteria bacterium RIFCSPHIGHO2_12_FULL_48_21]|nr:MAG: hypothetical protein A3F38_02310 [Candidatus Saccharibacteria bacterium RIFCSPHIGHO2_12_FULL_48_21]